MPWDSLSNCRDSDWVVHCDSNMGCSHKAVVEVDQLTEQVGDITLAELR